MFCPRRPGIARGKILPLAQFDARQFDAVIFPGGFGVEKNLSDFAVKGVDCTIQPDVRKVIESMHSLGKPIGAVCVAPLLLARVLGNVRITLGPSGEDSAAAEVLGATHQVAEAGSVVVDAKNKIVSAPCYLADTHIGHIAVETEKVVQALLSLMS